VLRLSELKLPLAQAEQPEAPLRQAAARLLGIDASAVDTLTVFKRSFDARKADLLAVFTVDLTFTDRPQEAALLARHAGHPHIAATPDMAWRPPVVARSASPVRPVVIGFGPCGIFAALVLAQMGLKPIVIERGKPVRERTQDTWGLWRKGVLHAESNVQFGEGGAGTFSDGKLWSQIKDPRHLGRKVMAEFVQAGAPPEILYAAHPHIGTFKLVKVVENLREQILAMGGDIRFQQRVTGLLVEDGHLRGLDILHQDTGATSHLRDHRLPIERLRLPRHTGG